MRAAMAALLLVTLAAATLPASAAAQAAQVEVRISAPAEARLGEEVQIQVTLQSVDGGAAVADAEVTLHREATFGGVAGDAVLARGITDEDGVAVLDYEPRTAGDVELRMEYAAPDSTEPEAATVTISVTEGPQLHRSTAGIQVPGLNIWLLVAVLTGVWGILFAAALMMHGIARAGAESTARPTGTGGYTGGREHPAP